jgi:hypothetical protein
MHTTKDAQTLAGSQDLKNFAESVLFLRKPKMFYERPGQKVMLDVELHPVKIRGIPEYEKIPYQLTLTDNLDYRKGWRYNRVSKEF